MENIDALFNPQVDTKEQQKTTEEYSPSAAKGSNNTYKAVIRFIPWWDQPKNSIIDKWTSFLVDPVTERGRYVDCPSSIGEKSILQEMYFKLKKSENVALQNQAQVFSRRHQYASLVQVIKDPHNKEAEGKILVFRYGVKIWEKINAQLKPVMGQPHNPFDIINGKPFALVITKVSGYNNYDQSGFLNEHLPLCIPDDKGELQPISATSDKQFIFNWVKENSPNLDKYGFKEWDQDTHAYVNSVIAAVTGQSVAPAATAAVKNESSGIGAAPTQQAPAASEPAAGITTTDINVEDLTTDIDTNIGDITVPSLDNKEEEAPQSGGVLGNLDDLMSNI